MPDDRNAPAEPPRIDLLARVADIMAAMGAGLVLALMLLVVGDTVGRRLFGAGIGGAADLVLATLLGSLFLPLAGVVMAGRLQRIDFLQDMLGSVDGRIVHGIEAVFAFLGVVAMAIVGFAVFPILFASRPGDLMIAQILSRGAVLAGAAVAAIAGLRIVYRLLMSATAPGVEPKPGPRR